MHDRPPLRPAAAVLLAAALAAAAPAGAQPAPDLDAFGLLVAQQSRPSFSILGAGARAAGMGGAFTALADDASAASFNPAGLALLLKPEASIVLEGKRRGDAHAAFTDLEDGVLETYAASATGFDAAGLNFASATLPLTVAGRNLSLQLSYHRLIDFSFDGRRDFTERDAGGAPLAELAQRVEQSGDVHTFSLAGAYQLTQRLSLGLTLSRWSGDWRFATTTREHELADERTVSLAYDQDNAWRGWNYTAGLLLRYRYLNFGAAYRSEFDGDYVVGSELATSFPTPFGPRSRFEGTLHWPHSYTLGLALKPLETWVVTADYSDFDWDEMVIEGLGPDRSQAVNFFDLQPTGTSTTDNIGQWRFGTEVTFFPAGDVVALRGGWFDLPRPQLLSPGDEKSSYRGFSAGVGWRRGPLSFDLAYQRATASSRILQFVDPVTVASGVVAAQAEGRVDTVEQRLALSLLYQFDNRRWLAKVFHFLFIGPVEGGGDDGGDEPPASDER